MEQPQAFCLCNEGSPLLLIIRRQIKMQEQNKCWGTFWSISNSLRRAVLSDPIFFSLRFTSKTRSLLDREVSSACRVTLISQHCASPGSPRWSCASQSGSTPWTRSSVVWCGTASASSSETIQPWVNLSYFNFMLMRSQMHNLRVVWKNPATIVGELGTMVVVLIIGMLLPTFCKSS